MDTTATVNYHVAAPFEQAFHIDPNGDEGKLVSPELVPTRVKVRDVRNGVALDFARDGVMFVDSVSAIRDFDASNGWQETYNRELSDLLVRKIGAKESIVFDHTVRIDDPVSTRRPARNVHTDYSPSGAQQRLRDLLGERADDWEAGHFAFVNVWRPVRNPVVTAPLGFVLPQSVVDEDWVNVNVIYPDRVGAILGLVANEAHEWIYFSCMTSDEVALFNIFDNHERPAIAHSALDLLGEGSVETPRVSIESRTLVRY